MLRIQSVLPPNVPLWVLRKYLWTLDMTLHVPLCEMPLSMIDLWFLFVLIFINSWLTVPVCICSCGGEEGWPGEGGGPLEGGAAGHGGVEGAGWPLQEVPGAEAQLATSGSASLHTLISSLDKILEDSLPMRVAYTVMAAKVMQDKWSDSEQWI